MIKNIGKSKASKVNITYDPYILFKVKFFASYDVIEEGTKIYPPLIKAHESIEKVYIKLLSQSGFLVIGTYTDCSNMHKGELKDLTLIGYGSKDVIFNDSIYSGSIPDDEYIPIFDITECFKGFDKLNLSAIYNTLDIDIDDYMELSVGQNYLSLRVYRKSDVAKKIRYQDVIFSFDANDILINIDIINISIDSMNIIQNYLFEKKVAKNK